MPWGRGAHGILLDFNGTEPEKFVSNDSATRAAPILFQLKRLFWVTHGIEIVASIKCVGTAKTIGATVNRIRASLDAHARDCAWLPAKLCSRIDLCIELLNRIDWQDRRRIADNRGRVRHAEAHEGF